MHRASRARGAYKVREVLSTSPRNNLPSISQVWFSHFTIAACHRHTCRSAFSRLFYVSLATLTRPGRLTCPHASYPSPFTPRRWARHATPTARPALGISLRPPARPVYTGAHPWQPPAPSPSPVPSYLPAANMPSATLVIFGAGLDDISLASNFFAFIKLYLRIAECEVTAVSSIDLGPMVESGPLIHGYQRDRRAHV